MISLRARIARTLLRLYTYPLRRGHKSLSRSVRFTDGKYRPPHGFHLRAINADGVRIELCEPPESAIDLLHFHGGGHTAALNDFYRRAAERYAELGARVYSIDYQAGKERTYPTVHDECFRAYRAFVEQLPEDRPLAAVGDSFGANLLLSCCLRARDLGIRLPSALICISPFADLAASGDSYQRNCHRDPLYALPKNQSFAEHEKDIRRRPPYCGSADPHMPDLSPAYADLHGISKLLLLVGEYETSASDAEMLARNARRAGVPVFLHSFTGMWHDFLYLFPSLPESRAAYREIEAFLSGTRNNATHCGGAASNGL